MKVPVKVLVDPVAKSFEIEVGTPPASALILKELGIEKGSSEARTTFAGDLSIEQAIKVATMKKESILSNELKAALMEISGTCVSMGIKIDGKPAKEFQKSLSTGDYSAVFEGQGW
jgi:large subunit ribosomal protein L11